MKVYREQLPPMVGGNLPPGWLTDEEAAELRRLADGRTVLELGAWKGRSTVALAATAAYVVSIDRHQGIPWKGGEDSLPDYLAAVRGLENVAMVVGDWARLAPHLGRFELVYIDGWHDSDSVEADTRLAVACEPDVIAFHDWDHEEVQEGAARCWFGVPHTLVGTVASFASSEIPP